MKKIFVAFAVCIFASVMGLRAQNEKFLLFNAGYQMPILSMKDGLNNGIGFSISRISYNEKLGGSGIGLGVYSFSPKSININGMEFEGNPYTLLTLNLINEGRLFGKSDQSIGFMYKANPGIGYRLSESTDEEGKLDINIQLGLGPRFRISDKTFVMAMVDFNTAYAIKTLFKEGSSSMMWWSLNIGLGYKI